MLLFPSEYNDVLTFEHITTQNTRLMHVDLWLLNISGLGMTTGWFVPFKVCTSPFLVFKSSSFHFLLVTPFPPLLHSVLQQTYHQSGPSLGWIFLVSKPNQPRPLHFLGELDVAFLPSFLCLSFMPTDPLRDTSLESWLYYTVSLFRMTKSSTMKWISVSYSPRTVYFYIIVGVHQAIHSGLFA